MGFFELQHLTLRFGGLVAVNDVSFEVQQGEIISLIGPNGAGKTSVFNAITGIYQPTDGRILIDNHTMNLPLRMRSCLGFVVIALGAALSLFTLVHAQSLWSAFVVDHYIYQQPFPWRVAIYDLVRFITGLPLESSVVPLVLGFLIGGLGAIALWRSGRCAPDVVVGQGVARTFQNIRLFKQMSALENVLLSFEARCERDFLGALLRLPRAARREREHTAQAVELLRFVGLEQIKDSLAGNLPYGYQRRLEIARALATRPKLLLLDEPAAGMNPAESGALMELIRKIRDNGITVLLIEHHMQVVMGISDRVVVLDYGNKIAEGTPQEVKNNPRVIEAYLGKNV